MKKNIILLVSCFCAFEYLAAQVQITTGAVIKITGTGLLTLHDINLVNDGTFNQTEGTVIFSGNSNNTITGTAAIRFNNLQLAKGINNQVALLKNISVDNEISFTAGKIDLNGFNILLSPAALLIGETENSRITGSNGGYVEITNVLNAPAAVNPGNLGAVISTAANMGSTRIRRGHQSQTNGSNTGNSIFRYYDIEPANNAGLNAILRFQYFDAELNGLSENIITQWKSANTTNWFNQGFNSRSTAVNYVEKTGIADFARSTLSTPGNVLPVTGLELNGLWQNNIAKLSWKTETETNNHHFIIQRYYQTGSQQFSDVQIVPTRHPAGNSNSITWYNYADVMASASQGFIYYRIQQVDIDNRFSFSNTIRISPDAALLFIDKIYPTIAENWLNIKTGNAPLQKMMITIYDMAGKTVFQNTAPYQSQQILLPAISSGVYQIKIQSGEWEFRGSIIKH